MVLTEEHNMLLQIRDGLYEGRWDLFEHDLQSRLNGEAYVFNTVAASPALLTTIRRHLELIGAMKTWEDSHAEMLRPVS